MAKFSISEILALIGYKWYEEDSFFFLIKKTIFYIKSLQN